MGRYALLRASGIGVWLGTELSLWREFGTTPLWVVFPSGKWGRAAEVRGVLEPWTTGVNLPAAWKNNDFAVGIPLIPGEEVEAVVDAVVRQITAISEALSLGHVHGDSSHAETPGIENLPFDSGSE